MLCASWRQALHWIGPLWCAMAIVAAEPIVASEETSAAATLVQGSVNFELDVLPILSSAGCNAGACHGKSRGQNGFALSILGFDPQFDYSAIALEGRGRRVFPAAPENSLLLRKVSLAVPHGGGQRLKPGSAEYETLRLWIAA